jgi:hypothetical protein
MLGPGIVAFTGYGVKENVSLMPPLTVAALSGLMEVSVAPIVFHVNTAG